MEDRGFSNKSLSRWASRENSKNGVSTDEELVSQNAHHFVELAADVVDISDVKASSFQAICFGKGPKCGASVIQQGSLFGCLAGTGHSAFD